MTYRKFTPFKRKYNKNTTKTHYIEKVLYVYFYKNIPKDIHSQDRIG